MVIVSSTAITADRKLTAHCYIVAFYEQDRFHGIQVIVTSTSSSMHPDQQDFARDIAGVIAHRHKPDTDKVVEAVTQRKKNPLTLTAALAQVCMHNRENVKYACNKGVSNVSVTSCA